MARHDVVMFNLSETTRDPRVRRLAATLAARGDRIVVLGTRAESSIAEESLEGFEIRRLPLPSAVDAWQQMRRLPRASPWAFDLLQEVAPQVAAVSDRITFLGRRAAWGLHHRLTKLGGRVVAPLASLPAPWAEAREVASLWRALAVNLRLAEAAVALAPSVVHCNDLNTLLAGVLVKRRLDVPLVYDAHEIFAEQFATDARSELWHSFYTGLERRLLAHTDLRLTVCASLARYFERTYDAGAFVDLPNVPSLRLLADAGCLERRRARRQILYHGVFHPHRGLEEVIAAVPDVPDAEFVFRGLGSREPALRALAAKSRAAARIRFAPPVAVDELIGAAASADVGLNPFLPTCRNTEYALPNKFFEYMMAGLAVASTDLVEMRALTKALQIGVLFDPQREGGIAAALNGLLADPDRLDACRRRAHEAARTTYHWENVRPRFLALYDQLR
ncbi:MAG: glycosyltransferase family 4 protein [Deltaproteobacteria bacterium]|nr:glycosyltransferase family 4 protein [Deltaproteobacteria bacterium]